MKTISILGCGWLGKPLGGSLVKMGFKVLGSTTSRDKLPELEKEGIIPVLMTFNPGMHSQDRSGFFYSEILIISIPPKRKAGLGEEYIQQIHEILKESKAGAIKDIILISSTSVYPDVNSEVTEVSPTKGEEDAMVRAERMVKASSINSTILRFAGLAGPGRHPGRFFANKKDIAGAECPVNLIQLEDCIGIIKKIITEDAWGEVFNACADLHPSKKDFYTKASEKLSFTLPEFSDEEQSFKIINSEKVKKTLNYTFKFPDPYQMI